MYSARLFALGALLCVEGTYGIGFEGPSGSLEADGAQPNALLATGGQLRSGNWLNSTLLYNSTVSDSR